MIEIEKKCLDSVSEYLRLSNQNSVEAIDVGYEAVYRTLKTIKQYINMLKIARLTEERGGADVPAIKLVNSCGFITNTKTTEIITDSIGGFLTVKDGAEYFSINKDLDIDTNVEGFNIDKCKVLLSNLNVQVNGF